MLNILTCFKRQLLKEQLIDWRSGMAAILVNQHF
jgi:hypothetical protein